MWSHGESGSGRQGLQQLLKVLIPVIWFCVLLPQPVRVSLPCLDPYADSRPDLDCRCHPASSFLVPTKSPRGGWEELTSSAFTCTSICHSREFCKCVCIYREADVNHICPVFLAKREREIFVTRVIGFPAICIKISRCDCWCLTWDQLKKEGISRTNCVHVDTWLVCVRVHISVAMCVF